MTNRNTTNCSICQQNLNSCFCPKDVVSGENEPADNSISFGFYPDKSPAPQLKPHGVKPEDVYEATVDLAQIELAFEAYLGRLATASGKSVQQLKAEGYSAVREGNYLVLRFANRQH